jgi:glycosyltransferase involved in cell wall biosynthesis
MFTGRSPVKDKLRMAMISTDIRRDLLAPLKYFKKLEIIHFYQHAPYSDFHPSEFKGLIRYRSFFDLCSKIKKCRPHVIQGSEPYGFPKTFQACAAAYLMSKILNVPLFFPMLESRPPRIRFGILGPALKKYLKIYAGQAKVILFLNNKARKNLIDAGVEERKLKRCMWGTWGVNTDEFSAKGSGLEPNLGKAILFVGIFAKHKGIRYLLPAFKKVKEVVKNLKLIMIGDGPLRSEIEQFAKKNRLEKDILLLGVVENKNMPNYFRTALITVIPSVTTKKFEEQVGMANIQSMACGVPVVSTWCGGIPEYVKHNKTGILVPERDSDRLADALIKLLKNEKLRKRLGKNARKYAVENFDAKKNIRKNEEIVLSLLRR